MSLMPKYSKKNKITYSDLQTPKEKSKLDDSKEMLSSVQCFSDLFPIVEENDKKQNKEEASQNLENKSENKSLAEAIKNKIKIVNSYSNKSHHKLNFTKASSQILDNSCAKLKGNNLDAAEKSKVTNTASKTSLILAKRKSKEKYGKSKNKKTEVINLSLNNNDNFESQVYLCPQTATNRPIRSSQEQKDSAKREASSQNQSQRRNRQDRLKSAHSSQRKDDEK